MSTKAAPRKPDKHGSDNEKKSDETVDEQLDQELEDSFPASDPPSLTQDPK